MRSCYIVQGTQPVLCDNIEGVGWGVRWEEGLGGKRIRRQAREEGLGLEPHSLPTEIIDLVSGPSEAQVLDVSSQKEFGERETGKK